MEKRNSRRHRKQGRNIWNWEVKVKVEVEKIERVGQRERKRLFLLLWFL